MITGKTKIFGVIADPIDHVRAPMVFNPVFVEQGIDAVMVPIHLKAAQLGAQLSALAHMPNMGGICVTIPFKLDVAALCDELGLAAQMTGAVNAVRFDEGRLIGDNFDGAGFTAGLKGEGYDLKGKSVLMIGAGGAARAIAASLSAEPIASLGIANRTRDKADAIKSLITAHHPNATIVIVDQNDIDLAIAEYDIIINTTSLGLHDGDAMPCALDHARTDTVIADIIMIPEITSWMAAAQDKGLNVHAGRHMLDYQRDLIGRFIGALPAE